MRKEHVHVGKVYVARLGGTEIPVRVDRISVPNHGVGSYRYMAYTFHVSDVATGRRHVLATAAAFLRPADETI